MRRVFKLMWVETKREWHLLDPLDDDAFVMQLPDCGNFRRLFDKPHKGEDKIYTVAVKETTK